MPVLNIIYASTSGHTEYVIDALITALKKTSVEVRTQLAEQAKAEDLLDGDVLLLASGTWNTGGIEGQMNPHMHDFLLKRSADVQLDSKKCALIALGDDRYYYTSRAGAHMRKFVVDHGGVISCDTLTIVNDPYGQEKKVIEWSNKLLQALNT